MASNDARKAEPRGISRRRFFLYGWGATVVAFLGEGVGVLLSFLQPRVEEGAFGSKIDAGKVEDFAVGSMIYFREGRFYLSRLEGGFLALYRQCTHLGCVAVWEAQDSRFHCPCHGGVFDEKGEVLAGPPPRPLDLFAVEIVEGEVAVDTGTVVRRERFEGSQLTS
jgi:cytochrome b6-f complex iron-sulfur subunit